MPMVWTAGRVHGAKRAGEHGLVFGLVDGSQLVFDGGGSGRVDGIDVKETMVQSARLDGWAIILFKDVAIWFSASSASLSKEPYRERSSGRRYMSTHGPLTKRNKS